MKTYLRTLPHFAPLSRSRRFPDGLFARRGCRSRSDTLPQYSVEDEKADKAGKHDAGGLIRPRPARWPASCRPSDGGSASGQQHQRRADSSFRLARPQADRGAGQGCGRRSATACCCPAKYTKATAYGQKVTVMQVSRAGLQVSNASSDNFDSGPLLLGQGQHHGLRQEPCPTLTAQPLGGPATSAVNWTGRAEATAALQAEARRCSARSRRQRHAQRHLDAESGGAGQPGLPPFGSPTLK